MGYTAPCGERWATRPQGLLVDVNPDDPCAYVSSIGDASCQDAPGLWDNGLLIYGGWGGGEGGGGGGGGSPTGNPTGGSGGSSGGSLANFPNGEHLGIPNGVSANWGGILGAVLPIDPSCEFGTCLPGVDPFAGGPGSACWWFCKWNEVTFSITDAAISFLSKVFNAVGLSEQKQIRDVMAAEGIPPSQYEEFSDFIHECKQFYGQRPNQNFTFAELRKLAQAFKSGQGCPELER